MSHSNISGYSKALLGLGSLVPWGPFLAETQNVSSYEIRNIMGGSNQFMVTG